MIMLRSLIIFICFNIMVMPILAKADRLTVDLDQHLIEINTSFTGSDLLLFGSVIGEGDILVMIKGPPRSFEVTRQQAYGGLWLNADQHKFERVRAFYHYAVTSPAALDLPFSVRQRHRIGLDHIHLPKLVGADEVTTNEFQQGLIRNRIETNAYKAEAGKVERRGDHLFRLQVYIPADVPVGTYQIETLLIRDRKVISAQTSNLFISKVGLNSKIFYTANHNPVFYGLAAIVIAVAIGYLANLFIRSIISKIIA